MAIGLSKAPAPAQREEITDIPTSPQCPANGCPFPADVGRAGSAFMCVFHVDVQPRYWNVVTSVLQRWWPVWQLAQLHQHVFNDLDAADYVIHQMNAMDVMRQAGVVFKSELEYPHEYDLPLMSLMSIINHEIEVAAASVPLPSSDAPMKSAMDKVKHACSAIRNRMNLTQYIDRQSRVEDLEWV